MPEKLAHGEISQHRGGAAQQRRRRRRRRRRRGQHQTADLNGSTGPHEITGRTDGAAPFKFHESKGATAKKRFPFANGGGILAFPRVIVVVAGVGGGGGGVRVGNILKADGEEEEGGARILPTSSSIVASF